MNNYMNSSTTYTDIEREDIQYTYCREFNHISRYKGLRQVVHQGSLPERYIALETPNPFQSHANISYYKVPANRVNRLDLIAQEKLGSASYSWIIAYFNNIEDGYSVQEGMQLAIPSSVSSLFENGEILSPISPTNLNLGSE